MDLAVRRRRPPRTPAPSRAAVSDHAPSCHQALSFYLASLTAPDCEEGDAEEMLQTVNPARRLRLALGHLRLHPPAPMEPLPNLALRVTSSRQVLAAAAGMHSVAVEGRRSHSRPMACWHHHS